MCVGCFVDWVAESRETGRENEEGTTRSEVFVSQTEYKHIGLCACTYMKHDMHAQAYA